MWFRPGVVLWSPSTPWIGLHGWATVSAGQEESWLTDLAGFMHKLVRKFRSIQFRCRIAPQYCGNLTFSLMTMVFSPFRYAWNENGWEVESPLHEFGSFKFLSHASLTSRKMAWSSSSWILHSGSSAIRALSRSFGDAPEHRVDNPFVKPLSAVYSVVPCRFCQGIHSCKCFSLVVASPCNLIRVSTLSSCCLLNVRLSILQRFSRVE